MNNKSNNNFSLRKFVLTALVAGPLATLPAPLWALPSIASTNLTTTSGVTVAAVSGNTLNVTQTADKQVLSWVGFGNAANPFNAGETINIFQPSASSSILNLVTGGYYSSPTSTTDNTNFGTLLNGTIAANGNVYFLNPNGITIGTTGVVNVGGFYASTAADPLAANSFALNGTLTYAGPIAEKIIVSSGANLQAVGSGLNIRLVGKGVDINGGNFYGNLTINSNGGNATLGGGPTVANSGQVVVDRVGGAGGNLTITTAGGNAKLSGGNSLLVGGSPTVTLSSNGAGTAPIIFATVGANNTVAAGKITGYTIVNGGSGYTAAPTVTVTDANGASVTATTTIAGGAITGVSIPSYASPVGSQTAGTSFVNPSAGTYGINVTGNINVNTTGSSTNGNISAGSSMLIANTSGTTATFNTGTGTTGGNISIGSASFLASTITANNATIVEPATGVGSVSSAGFVVGGQYIIANNGGVNYTAIGAANNNSGTVFTATATTAAAPVATSIVPGLAYTIVSAGTTNFVAIGAANNNVGTSFTASAAGTGTGTASLNVAANNSGAPSASDISLNASVIAGNLGIWNNNSQIAAGTGTTSVGGTISLSQASNQLSFNGTGALTFALLQAVSTVNITSNGDIVLPYSSATAPSFSGAMTVSSITPAPAAGTSLTLGAPQIINGTLRGFGTIAATANTSGNTYTIVTSGTTDFTLIGAANNNVGTTFVSNAVAGTGSGTLTGPSVIATGSGYTSAPLVTVSSTVGTQAPLVLTTTLNGSVPYINLPTTVFPQITSSVFTASPGTTAAVTGTPTLNSSGQITGVAVTAGSGYTAAPTLTFTNALGQTQTFATTLNSTGGVASVIIPVSTGTTSIGTQGNGALARQLSVTSTGGKITGGFINQGSTLSLLAAGDITLTGLNANTGNSGALSITSTGGKITLGSFATNGGGTLRAPGDIIIGGLVTGLQGNITHTNTGLTITSTGGTVSAGQITSSTTSGFSIIAASDITLPISSVAAFSVTSTGGRILQAANTYVTQNGTSTNNLVTLNASGDILLTNPIINVDATAGGFTVGRVYTIAAAGTTDFTAIGAANNNVGTTFIASGIGLGTGRATVATGNEFNRLILQGAANGATGISIVGTSYASNTAASPAGLNPKAIIIANGTNATGPVSVTSAVGVALGTPSVNSQGGLYNGTDTLTFGNSVTLTANGILPLSNVNNPLSPVTGTINTFANNIFAFGNVSLNTASNNNAVLGTPGLGNLANYRFGAVGGNVGTGTFTINENTSLNLGNIVAGTVRATSLSGSIVNSGSIVAPTLNVTAGSIFSPNDVTLNNAGNQINQVNIINANNFSLTAAPASGTTTTVTAGSATTVGRAVLGNFSVTEVGNNNLVVNTAGGGSFTNVGFSTSSGAGNSVSITAPGNLTVQNATSSGNGTAVINAAGVVTLGSGIALNSTGSVTINATGASGRIVDSSNNIVAVGPVSLNSSNDINISKSGHSFSAVSLASGAGVGTTATSATDIVYTEAGSANLNQIAVNQSGAGLDGSLTVVSTGGSIFQTATTGTISVPRAVATSSNTASFSAAGGVTLTNPFGTNNIVVPITLRAASDSSIVQGSNSLLLANVAVTAGGLSVDTSALAGRNVTQTTGSTLFAFGTTALRTAGGAITLSNTGNNFGALSIASGGGNVAITEAGTINLASVVTGIGNFSATSSGGGIIQTTSAAATGFTGGINVNGTTALTAQSAGITLNSSNPSLGSLGVTLTTTGNVTVSDAAQNTVLGSGTNVGGTLTVRNIWSGVGTGTISDNGAGNITVTGNVLLDAGGGNITLSGPNTSLGALQVRGGAINIATNSTLNLNAGSNASGKVSLSSNQNIITSGVGTSFFTGAATSLTLTAGGTITITNPIFVANGLTFFALGAVDLSALSLIANLNGVSPVSLGNAGYKAPTP